MPALPSPGKIIKAGFEMGKGIDLKALCQLYLAFSGTATPTNVLAVANALGDAWGSHLSSLADEDTALLGVMAADLESDTAPQAHQSFDTDGTRSGAMTGGICTVVSKEISRRYRGGHPRVYWPFGGTGDLSDTQQWSTDYLTEFATAYAAFAGAFSAAFSDGITFVGEVNVSYFHGFTNHTYPSGRTRAVPTVRGTPVVDTVNSYLVRPYIGSQRRRNLVRQLEND